MYIVYQKDTGKIIACYRYDKNLKGKPVITDKQDLLCVQDNIQIDFNKNYIENGKLCTLNSLTYSLQFSSDKVPVICLLSDKKECSTGFGIQLNHLYEGLTDNLEKTTKYIVKTLSWNDISKLTSEKFDLLITLGDINLIKKITEFNIKNWIHWLVIDCEEPLPDIFWEVATKIPFIVSTTKVGQKILSAKIQNVEYIPHGIDLNVFKPLDPLVVKNFKIKNDLVGKFVVGCVNTNTLRKQLPLLLEVFEIFSKDKEDVILILKTKDRGFWHLSLLLDKLRCKNKVRIYEEILSPNGMNLWINMCDVAANTTMAEGFGLPTIEFLASNIPVIIGDHTSSRELTNNQLRLIKCNKEKGDDEYWRCKIDINDMVDTLDFYYVKWKQGLIKSFDLRQYVEKEYHIQKVIKKWKHLINKYLSE